MKTVLLYAVFGLLVLLSICCLVLGILRSDLIIAAAGMLLGIASVILHMEIRKILSNPFKKN